MKFVKLALLSSTIFCATASSAFAEGGFIDEVRFGGHWAQPEFLENGHVEKDQAGISAELLFHSVNIDLFGLADGSDSSVLEAIMNPRPHLGGMINLSEDGTHYAYTGLTWQFDVNETFFIEGGFGMAYTNADKNGSATRAALGAHFLFHESIGFGANISENTTMLISFEHLSHASLFNDDYNRGLSNVSMKLGYKF